MALWMILLYLLNFLILVVLVCFERRDPVVSLAWVMGFAALPVLGVIIFLIFGRGLKKKTRKQYAEKWSMDIDLTEKMQRDEELRYLNEKTGSPYDDMIYYLLNTNNSMYTHNNDVKIYTNAKDKYSDLIADIKGAKKSVNMLYFIIRNDEVGKAVMSALAEKARQGVEVRLLYDDFGCLKTSKHVFDELKAAGGNVQPFFKVSLLAYQKINHRNHRKVVVIDNKIGYTGGMNLGEEYLGRKKPSPWRDTHIRVCGAGVMYMQKAFILDWMFSTGEDFSSRLHRYFSRPETIIGDVGMQVVASGPDSKNEAIKCGMIKMLSKAKRTVYLQTPYFVPDKAFLTAIELAARSGVDVRVMLPGIPDKKYVYYTTFSFIGELLDAGVKVYTYPGFLHSKTMSVDNDVVTIGTSNADIRSFQLHFELNAFLYDEEKTTEHNRIFLNDLRVCHRITTEEYKSRGAWQQMKEGFFRLFSPIM